MIRRAGRHFHSRPGRAKGQALAEFALVAPVFFLLLLGIIEGGRFMFFYEVLHNATREGARYAIVNGASSLWCPTGTMAPEVPIAKRCDPDGSDVVDRVRSAAFGVLGSGVDVTPTWHDDNSRGATVTVEATYSYAPLIPIIPLPEIQVQAESSLVINY